MEDLTLPAGRPTGPLGPTETLALVGQVARAAIDAGAELLDAHQVQSGTDGRVVVRAPTRVDARMQAPEATRTGPTPATLVFSVAMIGIGRVLEVARVPELDDAHDAWLTGLKTGLRDAWGASGQAATDLLLQCLDRNPYERPHPHHLLSRIDALAYGAPAMTPHTGSLAGVGVRPTPKRSTAMWSSVIVLLAVLLSALALVVAVIAVLVLALRSQTLVPGVAVPAPTPVQVPAPTQVEHAPVPVLPPVVPTPQPAADGADRELPVREAPVPEVPVRPVSKPRRPIPPAPAPALAEPPAPDTEPVAPEPEDPAVLPEDDLIDPWNR